MIHSLKFQTLIFLGILISSFLQLAYSQSCQPDSIYRDSSAGVYPKPITPANPNGGIDKIACIGKPYEFVFTVNIPDTLTVPGIPTLLHLKSAKIDTSGAILNLPEGISYSCNPPNCEFAKQTTGCIILHGTPSNNAIPGIYKPEITLTINTTLFPVTVKYPGPYFPGEYLLTLLDAQCLNSSKDVDKEFANWYPNPADSYIKYSGKETVSNFKLINSSGCTILQVLQPESDVYVGHLQPGLYIAQWSHDEQIHHQILAINIK